MTARRAAAPSPASVVTAATGILLRADGRVFVQRRPAAAAFYPNYWEFPGGKAEAGESPAEALARELQEEVGARAVRARSWVVRRHVYPHGTVQLYVFVARDWRGEAAGQEGQLWRWREASAPPPRPFLPANGCLWKWLRLPSVCVVSAAAVLGVEATLAALPQVMAARPLLQLRDKGLPAGERRRLALAMARARTDAGGLFVVNDDAALAREAGADGLHLSSGALMRARARPRFAWVGASCHDAQEMARAGELGLDYALLSPVCATLTHVDARPMGWGGFAALARGASLPLFALGGLGPEALPVAHKAGAHGVAMMRRGWGGS